jgi:hypothetical protein
MCKQKLISNKFDLKQTIRALHKRLSRFTLYLCPLMLVARKGDWRYVI